MAKTTRKTEATTGEPKRRTVRRKPAADAASGATRPSKAKATKVVEAETMPAPAPIVVAEPTHDEVALRAYHIYLRRAGRPGNPHHDWLQAIEELRAERRRGIAR